MVQTVCKAETETQVENKRMDTKVGNGSEMNWETGTDICTLLILCIKQMTNENLLYSTGTLLDALWLPKWEGHPQNRGYKSTCS